MLAGRANIAILSVKVLRRKEVQCLTIFFVINLLPAIMRNR